MEVNLTDSVEDTSGSDVEEVETDQPETEEDTSESVEGDDDTPEEASDDGEESEEGDEQPEEGSDPEIVTVEYDGEEYEVPKRLKDAVMATKDYTEKTQKLAEDRRYYEAEKNDFSQYMEASKHQQENMANLAAIDQQLRSFQAYDWNAAYDADITSATKLQHQMQQLQAQREQLVGQIEQSENHRTTMRHENMVRTAQRTDAQLTKEIPNWGDERKTELGRFAVETLGFPAQMVSNAVTVSEIKALHYAEIGFKAEQRVKAAQKESGKKKVITKPSSNLKPMRQSAPKTLSTVTDPNVYREMRLAQKRKKAS